MEKLIFDKDKATYHIGNRKVTPVLVYGPILMSYELTNPNGTKIPIDSIVSQIQTETGINLEEMANSYHSGGLNVNQPEQQVPDGTLPAQAIRHELIAFYNSQ